MTHPNFQRTLYIIVAIPTKPNHGPENVEAVYDQKVAPVIAAAFQGCGEGIYDEYGLGEFVHELVEKGALA